jgi:hypothetical protein
MHPAIFIPTWVGLGALLAVRDWINIRDWGYHIKASTVFEAWGVEFLIWGVLYWLLWRFLLGLILNANIVILLTRVFPMSIAFGAIKEMLWVAFFPRLPADLPPMPYWQRFIFTWKENCILSLVMFWCAFFLCRGIYYYEAYRESEKDASKLEAKLATAKLSVLRMQFNPHFLFNTLNGISSLMRSDMDAADDMLEHLSRLLRIGLERGEVQLIPLREEMDFIEVYLSLQNRRFAGRIKHLISIDPALYDALVPTMMMQPIVENAYVHGFAKTEREGELLIEARRQANQVHIGVINSGIGLCGAAEKSIRGHGIGLANVQTRLRLLYGVNSSFQLGQIDRTHVKVTIVVPLQFSPNMDSDKYDCFEMT